MAKSIALAADASRLASLLLSYIPAVCAFVAPRPPGASTAIIDRLSHSRALSGSLHASLLLALALTSCRRDERAPAPSASVSAAGSDFTLQTRERHFQEELERASTRLRSKPSLAECASALHEKGDLSLCQAAESALAALSAQPPAATPEEALTRLAPSALSLARLSERLRYLSLEELAQRRVVADDAGVAKAKPSPSAVASALASAAHARRHPGHTEQPAVLQSESPVSQLLAVTARWERDVLRNIGAYLEYGPTPARRAALDTVTRMRAEHPKWPALERLLREAAVLESDLGLKQKLGELTSSGSAPSRTQPQSADTK